MNTFLIAVIILILIPLIVAIVNFFREAINGNWWNI